jgi:hypothetical protein
MEDETMLEKVIKNVDKIVLNVVKSRKKGKRK